MLSASGMRTQEKGASSEVPAYTVHPALAAIAARHDVALMYLFGSQARTGLALLRGETVTVTDPLADVDLGVVFLHGLPEARLRPEIHAQLYTELSDLFAPLPLDLVFVEEGHAVFRGNVIQGICIFAGDPDFRAAFEERVAREAADFRPVLERALDEALEEV